MRSWIRCSRKAWLDLYGDENKRIWSAHRTLQLDHQERSFKALMSMKPERGIKGCENGALSVIGLRIKGFTSWNQSIQTHPSLLQRIKGKSIWGEFSYSPENARQ